MKRILGLIAVAMFLGACCPNGFSNTVTSEAVYYPDADACEQAVRDGREGLIQTAENGCENSCKPCDGTVQDVGGEPDFSVLCEEVPDSPQGPELSWRGVGSYTYGCDCA